GPLDASDLLRGVAARLRANARMLVQCAVAAGLAWWAARSLGHRAPFFAPVAAVIVLSGGSARWRRAVAIAVGIALGTLVADAIVGQIGAGPVQLGAVVGVAMTAAVVVSGDPLVVTQTATSAVLVVALRALSQRGRFVDALVGGSIAVGVHALVLPGDPARR